MDNIAATTSTSSSTTSTTSSNENNENPIAFTDLEKEIEALSVNELAETVKKNLDYIETKIGEYSTNMKSSSTGEEIVTESKQITTTVADRTSPVLRPTKSRSNSSSSSLTSYQDLPTSLHESFNACRNRITNQLERSFEQRHEQREEATMTESFLERVDNESPNIYSSSPQQQQQPQSNNSVDNDLMSSTLRRTYASPYLDPTRQVNTADYTSSFNENYMNSKIKPDYYYSTPDKTSSNNHNHNHDHLTTTAGTTSAYSYPMCRSAFESDPEVVLLRQHRLATRMTARPQSPTTTTTAAGGQQRYVMTTTTTTTTNKNYNNDTTNRNNDDDYMGMNLFSCRLKKEASSASIGKEEYDDDDTVESTHLDSDYAKSPIFPSDAYGSRPSVHIPTGIYSNKTKMESSPNLDKIYEESRQLDPEYIRLMDQKLRKMVKKTQYESINSRSNNEAANNANRVNNGSTTTNTVTWEIPVRRDLGETKSSKDLIVAHPPPPPPTTHSSRYLPEAQVPVHELVKKVRNEVESGASVDNVPHKLNEIWMRTQQRTQTGSNVEEYFSQQVDYDPLRNLIENPARVLIESNINPQRRGLLDVGGETQSKRSPRSGENTTTTTTTTTTSVKQSPTEAAAASTNKSTCLLHERILSKKLKHENRIKNLERLIELEKSKAKKLQEMISTSGKQQQQQQQQKQHQESLSTSPPGPADQSLSYIYESILNDEDDEDEEEEDGNCQCCSFEGGHEANNNDNRYQDRHNTSIGLNSARIVVDRSPSNERRTTTTTTTTRTTAAANESNVSEVLAATSRERKIPIVVEKKRAESWFFAVDNPKFANSHESIRRVEEVQRTTSSRPISSDQSEGGPKIYPHPYQPEGQKYWDYDPMAPHKTLQEAFNERRYDVVINSSSRVREIKAKRTRRELAKELIATSSLNHPPNSGSELNHAETEIYRSMAERLDYATKRQVVERHREWCVKNRRWAYFDELATPHAKSSMRCVNYHHHQMPPPNSSASLSQREIKERTRRKYEKLPEVQQRLLREKLEENKVKNRIKSTIFKKTIQQRVLSNGPNFNLNFKALEYSIQ